MIFWRHKRLYYNKDYKIKSCLHVITNLTLMAYSINQMLLCVRDLTWRGPLYIYAVLKKILLGKEHTSPYSHNSLPHDLNTLIIFEGNVNIFPSENVNNNKQVMLLLWIVPRFMQQKNTIYLYIYMLEGYNIYSFWIYKTYLNRFFLNLHLYIYETYDKKVKPTFFFFKYLTKPAIIESLLQRQISETYIFFNIWQNLQ